MIGQRTQDRGFGKREVSWGPGPLLKAQAIDVALAVAERLRSPERAKTVTRAAGNKNPVFDVHPWGDLSLSHGYPGVALLFAELHLLEPDAGWDRVAHDHLSAAGTALRVHRHDLPSLFDGPAAVAFAAQAATQGGVRYATLLERLDLWVAERAIEALRRERSRSSVDLGASITTYDVILGLSGTGRYLLHREAASRREDRIREVLLEILRYLVGLSCPTEVHGHHVPGWYVSAKNQMMDRDRDLYPRGNFNCGMAHGVAGPLALLSLTLARGISVPGQSQAIGSMAEWLVRWRQSDDYGAYWPDRVRLEEEATGKLAGACLRREAWCYGTPGVARSLWLAGEALDDAGLRDAALDSIRAVFRRPPATWDTDSPTFCHGLAGLLRITQRFALDTGDPALYGHAEDLARRLLGRFGPELPFGFRDVLPVGGNGGLSLDVAGLLEGAAGCALALLSSADERACTWDTAFLIA